MAFGTGPVGLVPYGTALGTPARPFVQGVVKLALTTSKVSLDVESSAAAVAAESSAAMASIT